MTRDFVAERDMPTICNWMQHRGLECPTIDDMPAIGVVVYAGGVIAAMAFLRRVEGGFGQIDGLCTDPEASPELRHQAIEEAVSKIVTKAKELSLKSLMGLSADYSTITRVCSLHGFTIEPHIVLVKRI